MSSSLFFENIGATCINGSFLHGIVNVIFVLRLREIKFSEIVDGTKVVSVFKLHNDHIWKALLYHYIVHWKIKVKNCQVTCLT
jgi:hypothetical protein